MFLLLQRNSFEGHQFLTFSIYFGLVSIMFFTSIFSDKHALVWKRMDINEDIPLIAKDRKDDNVMTDEMIDPHNEV